MKSFSKRAAVTVQFKTGLRLSQKALKEFVEEALREAVKKADVEILRKISDVEVLAVFPDFDDRLKGIIHHD